MTSRPPHALVQQAIDSAIASGREIGIQVAAYHRGRLVIDAWGGLADPASARPVDGDTLFNVYSVTKAVAATAIHMLVARGLLDYDAPVARYWPAYGAHGKEKTTVRHVLTHRACVPQMPAGVTPQRMCDWNWMTEAIADLKPLAEPGSKTLYLSMTFGWILGELIRRADPRHRSLGRFVREEIAQPLGIQDLWIGIPDELEPRIATQIDAIVPIPADHLPPLGIQDLWIGIADEAEPRIATQIDAMVPIPADHLPPLFLASMPAPVALVPSVFERPDVRRAEVAGVGGIFSARAEARFWSMLAQGGALDGVRLLPEHRVASLNTPRFNSEEADPVMFGFPLPITIGGFWFGGPQPPVASVKHARAICHPGQGGSIGWADAEQQLAVAICHNRLFNPRTTEEDVLLPIANAIRETLGLN